MILKFLLSLLKKKDNKHLLLPLNELNIHDKAHYSEAIKDNPILAIIFKEIEADIVDIWKSATKEKEKEECHISIRLLKKIKIRLEEYIFESNAEISVNKEKEKRKNKIKK